MLIFAYTATERLGIKERGTNAKMVSAIRSLLSKSENENVGEADVSGASAPGQTVQEHATTSASATDDSSQPSIQMISQDIPTVEVTTKQTMPREVKKYLSCRLVASFLALILAILCALQWASIVSVLAVANGYGAKVH